MSEQSSQTTEADSLDGFVRVASVAEVPDPSRKVFEVEERFVVVFHVLGEWHALDDCCTHDGGLLGEGDLEGFTIICPRHGARFDIRTGAAKTMPAVHATAYHEVKVVGEDVYIRLTPS